MGRSIGNYEMMNTVITLPKDGIVSVNHGRQHFCDSNCSCSYSTIKLYDLMEALTNIPHLILKYAACRFQKYISHYFVPSLSFDKNTHIQL